MTNIARVAATVPIMTAASTHTVTDSLTDPKGADIVDTTIYRTSEPELAFIRTLTAADPCPGLGVPLSLDRDPPLRIALFSGNYNCVRDGANRALNQLMGHVLHRGDNARVYSPTIARPAFAPAGELVSVASFPIPGRPEYRLAPRLPGLIAADVRAFAPDIIHVSAPDGLGLGAIRLARQLGVPVVVSMHTRFETYLAYYRLGLLRRPLEAWLSRFYNSCDLMLAPNTGIADDMRRMGVITPIRIWSRGVDPTQFSPRKRNAAWRVRVGIAEHEVAVLFLGRLVAEKGLDVYAAVIAGLRARGLPVRPLVIGDGPERETFIRKLGDAVLTGHLSGDELGQAVASADIFINPSTTEAFGNVTLEAMASGVCVVAADVVATRALIDDQLSGRLVAPCEALAYVDAASALIADAERRTALRMAALARAAEFDWFATLETVIDSYHDVLKRPLITGKG